ncbi:LytR family transcriptional attenuator [Actinocrispum wychmicini]|uniref:LytR family transcriptional attenuator n=2 Tax=Actinocrispum wychmicini TaxID=1213861 RepID=A0A4V2S8U2_9PSEU|nr:LytR family transcriptional attenuator [Actinocrispum wychmicini]
MPQGTGTLPRPQQRPPANGRPAPQPSAQLPIPPGPGQASVQLPIPPGQSSGPLPVQQSPGQASVQLPIPQLPPNQQTGANPAVPPALQRPKPDRPTPPVRELDPISMTTEMEAISESVQEIRRVDATLARFSAVHDELAEEERLKKEKRERMMPWLKAESGGVEEPDALAEDLPGILSQDELELAELPTELVRPPSQPKLTKRKHRPLVLAGRISAITVAAILLVAAGVVWGGQKYVDDQVHKVQALDENSTDIQNAPAQLGDENFLMVGSDTRAGADAEEGVGTADQVPGARSDTVIVAHIPKDRKRVVMVSFPRDLEIQRPQCQRYDSQKSTYSNEQVKPAKNQKLNTAFQVGGPLCVTKVIQSLTGLKINHFVGIDFNGFKEMVDAVQGVEVCVERPMYDTELKTWIVQTPGQNVKLEGDAALNFVRARHVHDSPTSKNGDPTSDYGRMKRQQRFLSSLLRKAMSNQVLLDPGKLTSFINAFTKATFGEGIASQDLITLGRSLQSVGAGKVTFITVPTVLTGANERGNEVLRDKDNKNLFTAIINGQALPGETDAGAPQGQAQNKPPEQAAPPAGPVDPKTVKVQVLNGGAADGKAGPAATALRNQGFQVVWTDNSPDRVPNTVVRYSDNEAGARTLASAVPGAQLEKTASAGNAVILILGPDFKGSIVKANGAAPPPNNGGAPSQSQPAPLPGGLSTVNAGDTTCA